MAVIGVKVNKAWFIAGSGRPLNTRGFTVDFQDLGEPDTNVFRNLIESSLQKRVASDFQDQATFADVNARVNLDKFTTPANLPQVDDATGNPIRVNLASSTSEADPSATYVVTMDKAVYSDLAGKTGTKGLTTANYPSVVASADADNVAVVTPTQDGDSIKFTIKVPSLPLSSLIIDITYANLVIAIGASTLIPGFWYKFSYQCIHQIPYTNVLNTSSSLTIPIETLLVQAISANSLDRTNVRSLEHSQDIIHWRWEDNKVVTPVNEDPLFTQLYMDTISTGISPAYFAKSAVLFVSPQVNRTGRIYYREDTIQRIYTPYDFRGVVLRRWALVKDGSNNYVYNNVLTYTSTTLYKHHDIILDSGNYWLVVYPFTATTSITNHSFNLVKLNDVLMSSTGNTPQFIATNPTSYILYDTDTQYFSTKVEIQVSASFQDQFTFYNAANTLQAFNVRIKNYIPAWIEAVTWEFYPNIVFATHIGGGITPITNVDIDHFSYDLTLYNVTSVEIGAYCRDIFINGRANGNIGNIKINKNNQFLHIDQQSIGGESISVKRLINNIGLGNRGMILYGGSYDIGDNNNRIISVTTSNLVLGDTNYVAAFVAGTHELEDFNSFICFNSCVANSMGNRNRNVFNILGTNTKFGDFNTDITSLKPNVVEGVGVPHNNNTVGDFNSLIVVSGTGNYYNRVASLSIPDGATITSCEFLNLPAGILILGSFTATRSTFKDITNIAVFANSSVTDTLIEKTPSLTFGNVIISNSVISKSSSLNINTVTISHTTFQNVNGATIGLGANSTITYSKFEKVSNLTLQVVVQTIIGYLTIVNNSTINISSTLSSLANIVINHVTIENTSSINISEVNSNISKVTIQNSAGLSIYYCNLTNCSFISTTSLDLGSVIPVSLVPANSKITISDTTFEGVNSFQLLPTTNDATAITNIIFNITASHFSNVSSILIYLLAKPSKINQLNICKFSSIVGVNFGAVPLTATDAMTYDSSVFENITATGGSLLIASPIILRTNIKNYFTTSNGGICYRVSLADCEFDGYIYIQDTTPTPNYTFRNILAKFRGAGYYKKTTNASINTTGYSVDNRIVSTLGIPLDTIATNATDIDYKIGDATKVYGIQNVISGGNIVLTPVNITLV